MKDNVIKSYCFITLLSLNVVAASHIICSPPSLLSSSWRLMEARLLSKTEEACVFHFYFDIHDSGGFHRDEIGEEFISFEEARRQLQVLLPDIIREELPNDDLHEVLGYIRNENGNTVYTGKLTYDGKRH